MRKAIPFHGLKRLTRMIHRYKVNFSPHSAFYVVSNCNRHCKQCLLTVFWIGLHANGRSIARIFPKVCTIFQILIPISVITTTFSALYMKFATICTFSPAFSLNRLVHQWIKRRFPDDRHFGVKKKKSVVFLRNI